MACTESAILARSFLPFFKHSGEWRLTRGCLASILKVEVGEASRRLRNVVKEPEQLIHANDNLALAA